MLCFLSSDQPRLPPTPPTPKKEISDSLVKEASTLMYKHTILFYQQQLV